LAELVEAGRSGAARSGALAADRSARRIAAALRCRAPRAFGRKVLAKLGYRRLSVRPRHRRPTKKPRRRLKKLRHDSHGAAPRPRKDKPIEIWFQDEARIGQQGTLTRVWAKRGTRPRAPRDQRYDWAYLFGAACPQRRVAAGLVMPAANAETMSLHLIAIGRMVATGSHAPSSSTRRGLSHRCRTHHPDNVTLVHLPAYALNSIQSKTSGNICAATNSRSPSSTTTRHRR